MLIDPSNLNPRFITLSSLPKRTWEAPNKFVLVQDNKTKSYFIVFIPNLGSHQNIVAWYKRNVRKDITVCGGGYLLIDQSGNTIKAYGNAYDGKFIKGPVKEILEQEFPGYSVTIE